MPARIVYAVRAAAALAAAAPATIKAQALAEAHDIPLAYLYELLTALRRAGLVHTQRGSDGGYGLHRPPDQVTLGDIVRALDGPAAYAATPVAASTVDERLYQLWRSADHATMRVLDEVTLADLPGG
ncbi:MAG: Rrf2 family transcriptional regulator [Hamadaea sp.]|uniref:RrF2 family transcriptional regulator n=1 Tax=Hamadaea sp. TaxID=2024425 RepID=UPI0017D2ACF8|nr:Rrf2 family transcriptional regulator [Hamadaea sp.]NUR74373.1 Rrf2 family transcriptional regulator [Hamadaea sp.]NUT21558.1 Rrf2 family transcriptional regulator [Hamadaea sp.]